MPKAPKEFTIPWGSKPKAPKKFRAGPAAQKIIRQLVQSMTPENRRAFHQGLRVATREHITVALAEAHEAGREGCEFVDG